MIEFLHVYCTSQTRLTASDKKYLFFIAPYWPFVGRYICIDASHVYVHKNKKNKQESSIFSVDLLGEYGISMQASSGREYYWEEKKHNFSVV